MKMDVVAGSQNDEFYTPPYAVKPIIGYIEPNSIVWCPFDTEDSHFVKMIREAGHTVIASHVANGEDFFTWQPNEDYQYIISNPPYSMKGQVLERLFKLNRKFAMLVGVVGLFESKSRFRLFKENEFEIMFLSKRVSYFKSFQDQKPSLNPPFSSIYLTHGMLPSRIVFEEITKV